MRYFLLDKQFLMKQPCQARVIAISDKEFTREEIEQAKDTFKTIDTLVYISEDIPHCIEYDYMNDIIKEKEILPQVEILEEKVIQEPKKIFDDSVEIQPNVYYFYIDKKRADEQGASEIKATFERPVLNPLEYFGIETYMVKGNTIPYYVTYDNGIREATKFERYERGQYSLAENEVVLNNEVIELKEGQYVSDGVITTTPKPEGLLVGHWDWETHQWVDETTENDRVQNSLEEYLQLNNYLDGKEMEEHNVFEDYKTYVNECKQYLSRGKNGFMMLMAVSSEMTPKPSLKLEAYFTSKKQSNSLY